MPGGYLFATGGTGGHLFPAIAVAQRLRVDDPNAPIVMAGLHRPMEQQILSPFGFDTLAIEASSSTDLRRRPIRSGWRLWRSVHKCRQYLKQHRPRVVVGCGGYAEVPMVYAASKEEIPVVLLEQNVIPGRATRWLASRADVVCLSFKETQSRFDEDVRTVVTGNPIRQDLIDRIRVREESATSVTPWSVSSATLLILGGSLGSDAINGDVLAGIEQNPDRWRNWQIVHQTGPEQYEAVAARYRTLDLPVRVEPFLKEMAELLPTASIVVTRAGATTLAELACVGCAAVVVPWEGATDDHQTANAHWYFEHGAAVLARTSDSVRSASSIPRLWEAVERLADSPHLRQRFSEQILQLARPNAAKAVVRIIEAVLNGTLEERPDE